MVPGERFSCYPLQSFIFARNLWILSLFFPHCLLQRALKRVGLFSRAGFPTTTPTEIGERLRNASPKLTSPAGMVYAQPSAMSALSFPSLGPHFMIQFLETRVIETRSLVRGVGRWGFAGVPQRCCTARRRCRAQPAGGECPLLRAARLHRQSTWSPTNFGIFFFFFFLLQWRSDDLF